MRGHADCVQLLLEAGADKEKADERDYTPRISLLCKIAPTARGCLEAGANMAARTQDGRGARRGRSSRPRARLELLRQHDAPGAHP